MRVFSGIGLPNDAVAAIKTQNPPSYPGISTLPSVRERLYDEQGGRCAYCERRLTRTPPDAVTTTRIEHFHPQSGLGSAFTPSCSSASGAASGEQATVSWGNLLLSCSGIGFDGETCDRKKQARDVCADFRNPKRSPAALESLVTIDKRGRAVPHPPDASGLRQTIIDDVFALNDSNLIRARLIVLTALRKQLADRRRVKRGLPPAERRALAARLRADAATAEYASVRLSVARSLDP